MAATSTPMESRTVAAAKPTLTSPTTRSSPDAPPPSPAPASASARTGTFARADSPSVPVAHVTSSRPASATVGSVLTRCPSSDASG